MWMCMLGLIEAKFKFNKKKIIEEISAVDEEISGLSPEFTAFLFLVFVIVICFLGLCNLILSMLKDDKHNGLSEESKAFLTRWSTVVSLGLYISASLYGSSTSLSPRVTSACSVGYSAAIVASSFVQLVFPPKENKSMIDCLDQYKFPMLN